MPSDLISCFLCGGDKWKLGWKASELLWIYENMTLCLIHKEKTKNAINGFDPTTDPITHIKPPSEVRNPPNFQDKESTREPGEEG